MNPDSSLFLMNMQKQGGNLVRRVHCKFPPWV